MKKRCMEKVSSTFRELPKAEPAKVEDKVTPPESVSAPKLAPSVHPTMYMEKEGKPYCAKFLDAALAYEVWDNDTKNAAERVDEYFKEFVDGNKVVNDETGFKDWFREMERKVDVRGYPPQVKIAKIAEFIRYMERSKRYG